MDTATPVKPWYRSVTVWLNLALLVVIYLLDGLTSGKLVLPGVTIDPDLIAQISVWLNLILRLGVTGQALSIGGRRIGGFFNGRA